MGPCKLPSIEHYWNSSVFYNLPFWKSVMSRNRFQLLLRFLHFSDNTQVTDDRLYKIRPIVEHLNNVMYQNYIPNRSLSADESMVLWRGRLFFRQYIKNKRNKYGIKLYELCESEGLVLKISVYCGQSDDVQTISKSADVVLNLMENYLHKGYILYADNYYNSVSLTKAMTQRSTYICGTLRVDRRENPKDLIKQKLARGEMIWRRNDR